MYFLVLVAALALPVVCQSGDAFPVSRLPLTPNIKPAVEFPARGQPQLGLPPRSSRPCPCVSRPGLAFGAGFGLFAARAGFGVGIGGIGGVGLGIRIGAGESVWIGVGLKPSGITGAPLRVFCGLPSDAQRRRERMLRGCGGTCDFLARASLCIVLLRWPCVLHHHHHHHFQCCRIPN